MIKRLFMMKRVIGIISVFLLFASCIVWCSCTRDETKEVTIFGTVMDGTTPISGVTIQIELGGRNVVGQTVSGSDGQYEITFTASTESRGAVKATNSWYNYGLGGGQRYQRVEIPFSVEQSSKLQIDINFESVEVSLV